MTGLWLAGLGTGLGLIAAIGAQNVFVLAQGMGRRHLLLVPGICFLCDVALMTLGVCGVGALLASDGRVLTAAAIGGAVFLLAYGFSALRSAFSGASLSGGSAPALSTGRAAAATLAVTLLNPHVYLDTLVLMGSVGSRYPMPDRWFFLFGVLTASLVWFFGLSWFGRALSPVLSRPRVWRGIQLGVCLLLWRQSAGLFLFAAERLGLNFS